MSLSGKYAMDTLDLWTTYGVFLEDGTTEFLRFPERKESITNDWPDQMGIDIDLSTPTYKEREITIQCALIADNEADWWTKYNAFRVALMGSGKRMFYIAELSRSYQVIYVKCSSFTKFTRIKTSGKVAAKFTLQLLEPEPRAILTNASGVPLTDGSGNYLYG
jgi:hypothetical protein